MGLRDAGCQRSFLAARRSVHSGTFCSLFAEDEEPTAAASPLESGCHLHWLEQTQRLKRNKQTDVFQAVGLTVGAFPTPASPFGSSGVPFQCGLYLKYLSQTRSSRAFLPAAGGFCPWSSDHCNRKRAKVAKILIFQDKLLFRLSRVLTSMTFDLPEDQLAAQKPNSPLMSTTDLMTSSSPFISSPS